MATASVLCYEPRDGARYMRMRRSPRLLLLMACVIASVVMSDAASARSWLSGGHATPEHFALHMLYESMGIHDHHGHATVEDADSEASSSALALSGPTLTIAIPGAAADPGQLARDSRDGDPVAATPPTQSSVLHGDDPQPENPDFLVFDPPPRVAA